MKKNDYQQIRISKTAAYFNKGHKVDVVPAIEVAREGKSFKMSQHC